MDKNKDGIKNVERESYELTIKIYMHCALVADTLHRAMIILPEAHGSQWWRWWQ